MKLIRNWVILIVVLIGIAAALFITGKQHKVFIDNKGTAAYKAVDVSYSINGEKSKKLKVKKKAMVYVKGPKHEISIKFKDETGNEVTLNKEFKLTPMEEATISLPLMINDEKEWIKSNN